MKKTFLITGGAGFVGSHIAEALLARGDEVRVLDNFSTGRRENIPAGCEVVEASITNPAQIAEAFKGIDGVFHAAALPRVQLSIEDPIETNEVNLNGTLNVLLAAKAAGVKRVVYSASSAAYGDQLMLPQHEEMRPSPMSPYGLQKYVGEHYMKLASMFWGIETVSLRYFNIYGPRLSFVGAYVTVIAVFLQQKKRGEPMTITGDGTQTRDFIYVEDVVRANIAAMDSDAVGNGEVINIGTHENHSVNEVAELLGGASVHIPPRVEPHDTLADTQKAQKLLSWKAQVSFKDGLRKTLEWFNGLK